MSSRGWLPPAVAAGILVVDQLSMSWAVASLDEPVHVVWTLRLKLTYNSGGAFGLGSGAAPFFVAAAATLLVVLVVLGGRPRSTVASLALGLLVGGAAGNLWDRLLRDTGGAVVDFIDLQWWPVFNVADAAISVGAVLFVLSGGGIRGSER